MKHDFKFDSKLIEAEAAKRKSASPFIAGEPLTAPSYTYLGYVFEKTSDGEPTTSPLLNTVNFKMSFESAIRRLAELMVLEEFSIVVDGDQLTIGAAQDNDQILPLVVGSSSWCRSNVVDLSSNSLKVPLYAISSHLVESE
jgi:hypothetical protein